MNPAKLEAWEKAIEFYEKYLDKDRKSKDRKEIKKRLKILKAERDRIKADLDAGAAQDPDAVKTSAQVEALSDVAIRGLVVIESDPPDASIYLDDKKEGAISKTPWSGTIEGEHTVYIEKRGYKPVEKTISPSPDKLLVLSFSLAEEDYLGWIEIKSNVPGAKIYIDDKAVGVRGKTPFSGNLDPGKHKIWITADGYDEYYEEIEIAQGQTHSVEARLEGSPVGYLNVRGRGHREHDDLRRRQSAVQARAVPQGGQRGQAQGSGQALGLQDVYPADRHAGPFRGRLAGAAGQETRPRRRLCGPMSSPPHLPAAGSCSACKRRASTTTCKTTSTRACRRPIPRIPASSAASCSLSGPTPPTFWPGSRSSRPSITRSATRARHREAPSTYEP